MKAQRRVNIPLGPFLFLSFEKSTKEETIMATKNAMRALFGILAISSWVLGSAIQVGAEAQPQRHRYRVNGQAKLSREQADSRESRELKRQKSTFFQSKKGKVDPKESVKVLSTTPCPPNEV
jgi:hypothetical protein